MDLAFRNEDIGFRADVRQFIDRHWPARLRRPRGPAAVEAEVRSAEEQTWFDALVARGWSVPAWPMEHGGTGWTATRQFIWNYETTRAETPRVGVFAVNVVGPALCRWGSQAQQAQLLPPIREARVRWCDGCAEPDSGMQVAALGTTARRRGNQYIVNGVKISRRASRADWMLCLARTQCAGRGANGLSLLLIDMHASGVRVEPVVTPAEHEVFSRVTLSDVAVPVTSRLGDEPRGWTYVNEVLRDAQVGSAVAATWQLQLERLAQIAAQTPDGCGSVAEDAAFQRKYRQLEIELLGLEALELRVLAIVQARGVLASAGENLQAILNCRSGEIGQRVADLMIETLGYYALPNPDQRLIGNEGPVGHELALGAIQGWLSSALNGANGAPIAGLAGSNENQKDFIAGSALGLLD